jgi:hypothetical protein
VVYYIDLSFAQEVFEKFQMYKVMVENKSRHEVEDT